jgi:arginine utilization protein RocB
MKEEIEALTKKLVSICSVNGSDGGEKAIAEYIESYLREIPYFKDHPDRVIIQPLKDDALGRRNVMALLMGEKEKNSHTLIWHGHMDTVGVDDYKGLKKYSFDPDALAEALKEIDLPEDMKKDLDSGDYMFGRGALDMKSGDAVFLVLLKHLAADVKNLSGNILLSINPVEENRHQGIIEETPVLMSLKETYGLEYVAAINNDYTCPLYPDDPHHYIYLGTVGKLLPCFYIQGKETHVGQPFEGFDASRVASKLVEKITLNADFLDVYNGEYTLPPMVLKMKDLKDSYNVQTAFDSFVYFNYLVHNEEITDTIPKFTKVASQVLDEELTYLNTQYKRFCELTKTEYKPYAYDPQVYTYAQLKELYLESFTDKDYRALETKAAKLNEQGVDQREIPLTIIKSMLNALHFNNPVIVMYFAAPYCPHNTLKEEVPQEKKIKDQLTKMMADFSEKTGLDYKILQFFPSLSDSSYIKIDDSKESLEALKDNFPAMKYLYNLDIDTLKALNIPALDFGVYGKDAHKWMERVYKPYSFETLPQLILEAVHTLL